MPTDKKDKRKILIELLLKGKAIGSTGEPSKYRYARKNDTLNRELPPWIYQLPDESKD